MDKLLLLKYAAILCLIMFVSCIGLGVIFDVNLLITFGLLLFAIGSGLLTYYLVSSKA